MIGRPFEDIPYIDVETEAHETSTYRVPTAKRKTVQINNIEAESCEFEERSTYKTRELISTPVNAIGIHVNEYIPDHFLGERPFSYTLTVNGVDYPVEPINSHRQGTKIVRFSSFKRDDESITYVDESIKQATLTIEVRSENSYESAFLNQIKILYGEAES